MPDHDLTANRTPPEHVNRTTRLGADQYVLACNARRDAGDITFAQIEMIERQNRELRAALKHEVALASARRERFGWLRLTALAYVMAGMAALGGWMVTPNGRQFRVVMVEAYYMGTMAPQDVWKTRHIVTADMTQKEIAAVSAQLHSGSGKGPK